MEKREEAMGLDLPVESREDVCLGLLVKDQLHGASFDVESEDPPARFEVDYYCGDEMEDGAYRLLIVAEYGGEGGDELIRDFTEEVLEEFYTEAAATLAEATWLDEVGEGEVEFRPVPEDEERWDLVVPDWLAPDGAEVPFGFRPYLRNADVPWPEDGVLDRHGRVVVVPFAGRLHLVGTPMPVEEGEESATGPS